METTRIEDISALEGFAKKFLSSLVPHKDHAAVVGLSGELGAGKTAFVKALARVLGITETVVSPTFVLERTYGVPQEGAPWKHLVHIDAYRLSGAADLAQLSFHEAVNDPHTLICIEWPPRVADGLPDDMINLTFSHIDETTRGIEWEPEVKRQNSKDTHAR